MRIKSVLSTLFLASLALFVSARPAHALTALVLQEDANAPVIVATTGSLMPLSFSGTFGDFAVVFFSTNPTNGASQSQLTASTTQISLLSGSSTHTLTLFESSQDYTLPTGPSLLVTSGEGGSYVGPGIGAVQFQAYADKNNNIGAAGITDFTNGLQTANPPSGNATTFDTGDVTGVFTRNATPFSLTSISKVTLTNAGACGPTITVCTSLNYSNHEFVTPNSVVPEPASMLLLGTGMIGLAGAARRRFGRKK